MNALLADGLIAMNQGWACPAAAGAAWYAQGAQESEFVLNMKQVAVIVWPP